MKRKAWNKGIKLSEEHKEHLRGSRPKIKGENNPMWKGDNATYGALHMWVYKWKGKANYCIFNKNHPSKHYEWANVSGEYKRDLDDWIPLCGKCHRKYDNVAARSRATIERKYFESL